MIELILKDSTKLSYNTETNEVKENGKISRRYSPVFIPSGDDDPDFFGFLNSSTNVVHDIHGNESKLASEKDIKL